PREPTAPNIGATGRPNRFERPPLTLIRGLFVSLPGGQNRGRSWVTLNCFGLTAPLFRNWKADLSLSKSLSRDSSRRILTHFSEFGSLPLNTLPAMGVSTRLE